jgi:hypothetical protein
MKIQYAARVFLAATAVSLSACSSVGVDKGSVDEVRQITQSDHCGLTGPGLAYIDSVEKLESLLGVSGQNLSTRIIREVDLVAEHLVFVTLGEKPTAGFSVALDKARFSGDSLTLEMLVRKPQPDMIVAQVITSPCAVVAVPGIEWRRLEVFGVTEKPLVRNLDK